MRVVLKDTRFSVFRVLQEHANNGECCMSHEEIAQMARCCEKTVRNTIRFLHDQELIVVTKHYGERRNVYRILN